MRTYSRRLRHPVRVGPSNTILAPSMFVVLGLPVSITVLPGIPTYCCCTNLILNLKACSQTQVQRTQPVIITSRGRIVETTRCQYLVQKTLTACTRICVICSIINSVVALLLNVVPVLVRTRCLRTIITNSLASLSATAAVVGVVFFNKVFTTARYIVDFSEAPCIGTSAIRRAASSKKQHCV